MPQNMMSKLFLVSEDAQIYQSVNLSLPVHSRLSTDTLTLTILKYFCINQAEQGNFSASFE